MRAALDDYPMFVRFADDGTQQPGAVTVVLTGDAEAKCALVGRAGPRPYVRDSNTYAHDDRPADGRWDHYALE